MDDQTSLRRMQGLFLGLRGSSLAQSSSSFPAEINHAGGEPLTAAHPGTFLNDWLLTLNLSTSPLDIQDNFFSQEKLPHIA
jgi:hypothetical protein